MNFKRIGKTSFRLEFTEEEIKILNKQNYFDLTVEGASKFATKLIGAAVEIRSEVYKINKDIGKDPVLEKDEVIK